MVAKYTKKVADIAEISAQILKKNAALVMIVFICCHSCTRTYSFVGEENH